MDDLFKDIPEDAGNVEVPNTNSEKKAKKKQKMEEMKAAFKEAIELDPDYTSKLNTLSDSLQVINTLGYAGDGGLIEDKERSEAEGKRVLSAVGKIVGYRIKNIGEKDIPYQTESWSKDENGVYVGTKVSRVLHPGDTADLTRQYMTMLGSAPEISFTLQNGTIMKGSGSRKVNSVKEELETYYFSFDRKLNIQVNDDEVKLAVAEREGDTWVVKEEFVDAFGYLNNKPEGKTSGRKAAPGLSVQTLYAAHIAQLLRKSEMQ